MGIEPPSDVDGVSFAQRIRSGGQDGVAPRELVYMEWQDLIFAVRDHDAKYIFNPHGVHPKKPPYFKGDNDGFPITCEELYVLPDDPREQFNRFKERPALVKDLRALLLDHRDRPGAVRGWQTTEDAEILKQLAEQGYVGSLPGRPDVVFGVEDCGE